MKKHLYDDIRGYNQGVTGSCIRNTVHFTDGECFRFLVDHGMYQGEDHTGVQYNDCITPKNIGAVLLTHTHLDHDGGLPAFVKQGYSGNIYMSDASDNLIDIGLNDTYNIMKRDSKLKKQEMLFSQSDVEATLDKIVAVPYEKTIKIHDRITVTFFNNGHLVGASMILVQISDIESNINLLFTGDYKPSNIFVDIKPLPFWVYSLDNLTIISESTYGTTNSWDVEKRWEQDIVQACLDNALIFNTGFGQGRIQELMLRIRKLQDEKRIPKDYPVKIDGTTAQTYTFRYLDRANILHLNEDAMHMFPYSFQFVDDKTRESVLSNNSRMIVLSTSGMGTHGPASIYIPHFLSNPKALIYFPGYNGEGTLARKVLEAKYDENVIFKNSKSVIKRAKVLQTGEFSSHATADELIDLFNMFAPKSILFIHGDSDKKIALEKRTIKETGVKKTGILGMGLVYRINQYGIEKSIKK